MTTPPPGVTVITASGNDYVVPKGQSWTSHASPTGELLAEIFNGPWGDAEAALQPSGTIIASFSDVEAVFPTGEVSIDKAPFSSH